MNYADVFHPAAPIDKESFLVGREDDLRDARRLLARKAECPIIIGSRGIGNTSVVKVLTGKIKNVAEVNCTRNSTFDDIAKKILRDLGFDVMISESVQKTGLQLKGIWRILGIGELSGQVDDAESKTRLEIGQVEVDEHLLYQILSGLNKPITVSIDEYDLVKGHETKERIADFIKMISDNKKGHRIRLIFSGVARSKTVLIGSHRSVNRQTHEIFLRPLSKIHFMDYMAKAENELRLHMPSEIKTAISDICFGQPYYLHLLCIEAIESMLERDSRAKMLIQRDFENGKERAARKAYRDHLFQFGPALNRIRKDPIAFKTLGIICESKESKIKIPTLTNYINRTSFQALEDFQRGLSFLKSEQIIFEIKESNSVSFPDPLLRPFLLMRFAGLRKKSPDGQLSLFFD